MYVIDTNVWMHVVRGKIAIEKVYSLAKISVSKERPIIIPAAVKAELESLALQHRWTTVKQQLLEYHFDHCILLNTNQRIISIYAHIDAFSQGRLPTQPTGLSARNMGKNDLWIAATAIAAKALLITTDSDFDHLQGHLFGGTEFRVLKPAF
jgi:tRNA(fMet)-specific endonuclease VapC